MIFRFYIMVVILFSISCSDDAEEKEIPVSELPSAITAAIQDTLPDFKITGAKIESEEDLITYEIDGIYHNTEFEIEVSSNGRIIEIDEEKPESDPEDSTEYELKNYD